MNDAQVPNGSAQGRIYDALFWQAYLANLLLACGISLNYRFADFIAMLGGSAALTGELIQAGLIAAMLFRFGFGWAIDRFRTRACWLVSGMVYIGSCLAFIFQNHVSPVLWLSRIAYAMGIAGMFCCSLVFIQARAAAGRRTQLIGSLGSAGFIGTILGAQLGDAIFATLSSGHSQFVAVFVGASLLGAGHVFIVLRVTRDERVPRTSPCSTPLSLPLRKWPAAILFVAMVQGAALVVNTVFLARYVSVMNLRGIGVFFLVYSLTAFSLRWLLREWATVFGRDSMVVWGLAGLAAGQVLFLTASSDWLLVLPAFASGFGFALLSPAVISIVAGRFPPLHRGIATAVATGFTDLGMAIAAPLLGKVIDLGNLGGGTRGFTWMFLAVASAASIAAFAFILAAPRERNEPTELHDL